MTDIVLKREGNTYTAEAKGHATGNQDVCSAVSAIFCALAKWVEDTETDVTATMTDLAEGDCFIRFRGRETVCREVARFVRGAFELLSYNYPDYVKLTII